MKYNKFAGNQTSIKDSITRSSNAKIEFSYTWVKQIIVDVEWNYLFQAEKWFTNGKLHMSKYPNFWDQSIMGGDKLVRGYLCGRYRRLYPPHVYMHYAGIRRHISSNRI